MISQAKLANWLERGLFPDLDKVDLAKGLTQGILQGMKAELRDIHCISIATTLENYLPEVPDHFSLDLTLSIGPQGEKETDPSQHSGHILPLKIT